MNNKSLLSPSRVSRRRKLWPLMASLMVIGLVLSACSSQGGKNAGNQAADTPRMKVAFITHASPGDTFWDTVRKGAEAAAAKNNVDLVQSNDDEGGRQSQLVQQAIDQKVDGIAVTLAKPEAVGPTVKKATEAGIPAVAFNGGGAEYSKYGAFTYFGSDEKLAGETVGERLAQGGYQKPICVIQAQGHVGLEARCAGVKAKVPGTEILYVQGTDLTQVASTTSSKLQATPDADAIIGLGAPITLTLLKSVQETGSKVKVASFDMSKDLVQNIVDKKILFTVDQQPWLQGYLSVDALWSAKNGGFRVGGGKPVLTGPTIVDESNAADILPYAEQGIR